MSRKQPEFSNAVRGALRLREEDLFDDSSAGQGERMLHLRDLIPRLLARWHWMLLCGLLGLGWGFYQVWRAVPIYQASASVLVRDYNMGALGQMEAAEFDVRSGAAMETIRAGMTTFEMCEGVASDPVVRELRGLRPPTKARLPFLGESDDMLDEPAPPAPQLAGMISSWLSVNARGGSRFIDVSVKHPRPEVAKTIANRVVHHYIMDRTASRSSGQQNTLEFLIAESERVKGELAQAQTVISAYSAPLEAEKALAAAETNVSSLSLRYRAKHPRMIEAQARLGQAQEFFKKRLVRVAQNAIDKDYWQPHLARVGNMDQPGVFDQMRDLLVSRRAVLESEIRSQNSLYTSLLQQIETREVTTKQTEAEVLPHEPARYGWQVYPQKSQMIIKATVVGLIAGVGLAFLFQWLDNKFHTVVDVESHLHLPVLSAIAHHDEKSLAKAERKSAYGYAYGKYGYGYGYGYGSGKKKKGDGEGPDDDELVLLPGREKWAQHLVFRVEGANSHYAEMFRVLRTAISLLGPADQRKVTMITSALPSEGKTFVAANLAVALAQQGLRTLLVDFDLRKPSAHKMFGRERDAQPGVVDLLSGKAPLDECLFAEDGQENLWLMLSGPKAPNPGELLEFGRIEEFLQQFGELFDHIVLDTAPLLAVPDSRVIAPLADNLALVVRGEATPRGPVKRSIEILDSSGVTPEGVVFNGYSEKRFRIGKNYSYGYYRYGKYGYGAYGAYGAYGSTYGSVYGDEDEEDNKEDNKEEKT